MRRSEWVSSALVALAVGLGGFVVLDRDKPTTSEVAARAGMILRVFRGDDVTRIVVTRKVAGAAGNERMELLRNGDAWQMTAPRNAVADFQEVSAILNFLQGARAERSVGSPSAADRAQFGLDAPRVTVELAMKGVTVKVALGGPATAGAQPSEAPAYLEVFPYEGQPGGVFVVGADLVKTLDRSSDTYRDRSLTASRTSTDVLRLAVRRAGVELLALERGPHGSWRLPKGPAGKPIRADADTVNGLWSAYADLKADPFAPDDSAVDESKGGTLAIALSNAGEIELVFGGGCPVPVAGAVGASGGDAGAAPTMMLAQLRKPTLATGCVPAYVAERLSRAADAYVDRHPFGLLFGTEAAKISEIEGVTFERAGAKVLDVERAGSGLHVRVPADQQADPAAAARFLGALANIVGEPVGETDLAKLGLAKPMGRVTLRRRVDPLTLGRASMAASSDPNAASLEDAGAGELWEQHVDVGEPVELPTPAREKVVHLRREDDGAILRVSLDVADLLGPGGARTLRDPNLVSLPESQLRSIEVKAKGATLYRVETAGNGAYRMTAPAGLGVDSAAASELAKSLGALTCDRWIDGEPDPSMGFSSPDATIVVGRDAGAANAAPAMTLEIAGETADARVHARVVGQPGICVLPIGARDAFLRVPIDRSALAIDPSLTPRLLISRGSTRRTVVFREADKRWHDGADDKLAGARTELIARRVADRVVGLRTEAMVHLGAPSTNEGFDHPTLTIEGYAPAVGTAPAVVRRKITIGALGLSGQTPVYFARVDGLDATLAVLREEIDRLLADL
jgi:hypothetical protein